MSFYGSSFSFDGISCEEFGLMLYDFDNETQGSSKFSKIKVHEDRIYRRPKAVFYGESYDDGLSFKLVFGANEYAAIQHEPIDRQEMEAVSAWLTGHNSYKWLTIDQPDMEGIRYRCVITELQMIEVGFDKWAFSCEVHCDSPFAYTLPMEFSYDVDGTRDVTLPSRSSMNQAYYPEVRIEIPSGGDVRIVNHSDGDYTFSMDGVPTSAGSLYLNGESGVMTSDSGDNVYPYFNFHFPRLVRGDNHLTITGKCKVVFTCQFPVNVGG